MVERVRLHADLPILATLASPLARARAVPLAAVGRARCKYGSARSRVGARSYRKEHVSWLLIIIVVVLVLVVLGFFGRGRFNR